MKYAWLHAAGLFVVLILFAAEASASPADFTGRPVTSIRIMDEVGNPWPRADRLFPLLEMNQGDLFSRRAIRKGIEYLYLTGRFRDIRVDGFPDDGGVRLVYTLFPLDIVQSVDIEGNDAVSTGKLKDIVDKLEGKEFKKEKYASPREDVLALYQSQGFLQASVEFVPERTKDPHQVVLRVIIHESKPTIIENIQFSGNTVLSAKDLLRHMKSEPGDRLKRDLLLDTDMKALRRAYAEEGYPAATTGPVNISFREGKAIVTVFIDEGPKVTVRFSGNSAFSSRELDRALLIWQERDISDAAIESSVGALQTLYREEGYADVKVNVVKTGSPGRLDLEFSIQEGPRVTVKDIRFEGNTAFRGKDLKSGMELKESGWFRSKPFREDLLRSDLEHIRDRYIEAGYPEAAVEKTVTRRSDGTEAVIIIKIKEGGRIIVGSVSFEGNATISEAEFRTFPGLRPGAPYNNSTLEEGRYRILSVYSNKGFLYARVDAESTIAEGVADIRFRIQEDRLVTVGKIILRGNDQTKDEVIMRELLVHEGSPYDYGAILKSQQRIYRLGFFRLVRFESVRPYEREYVRDMLLTVEERPAGAVEFGFGYGNLDRFRGFAELSYANLWGSAKSASLRVEGGDILKQAVVTFREPWFLGRRVEARFRLGWSDATRLNPDTREIYYETRKTQVSTGLEKVAERLKTSFIYQFENVENFNVAPGASLSPEDVGRVLVSSLTPGAVWDLRDDPFNPRKGSLHGMALKEALRQLGSDADFTKLTIQTSWFLPLGKGPVVALSARAGRAWPHGDTLDVPLHERFYLGGGSTIRGYLQDSVGPGNWSADGAFTPTGGDRMALFNAEIRIGRREGFGLVFFYDTGNVWIREAIELQDLRASYGIGIRYQTPVGPLRLDYGQKIHRLPARFEFDINNNPVVVPGESPGELHFNIGHAF